MAAVLACGPGAVLSHRDAAALLGLRRDSRMAIDVTVAHRSGRKRQGIDVHRPRNCLTPEDVSLVDNIACTSVARTLLDLAEVVNQRQLKSACRQAEVLQVIDLKAVESVIDRGCGRRGVKPLKAVMATLTPTPEFTRNDLELRFLDVCKRLGLPRPQVNCWIEHPDEGFEVDFAWPELKLIVETDGYETHGTRSAFEEDRRRDRRLTLAGWDVVRFTWRQVFEDRFEADLAELLERDYSRGQFASVSR
jgi:uncharacterized protein DUF559